MDQTKLMEDVLSYWRQSDAFVRSVESRSPGMRYKFYDGPPFTSGDPHYGHLLQSTVKDMVPRRMTMRGYRVERRWGWDCHGIPAENYVNKQLGITSRKQVEEEFGIQNYVEECRAMVNNVNENWQWFVDHLGRWVDMENAYFTMHTEYMESVMWVFSQLYHHNLIYKGFKVLGYSRALGTALSASEIAEGYEDRQDPAVTVSFPLYAKERSDQYEMTEDGFYECAVGLIKNDTGQYCMIYHQKEGLWFFPGGKVEVGEVPADTLKRELSEEVGVQVTHQKLLGHIKIVHLGKPYRVHYFEVELEGEPRILEPDKHEELKWVSTIPSENELGFAIKIDQIVIDDAAQIRREFVDYYLLEKGLLGIQGIDEAPMSLLAWTTTPWTLPSNMFAAVHPEIVYSIIYDPAEQHYYILARDLIDHYYKHDHDYIEIYQLPGSELVGLSYKPLFDYYYHASHIDSDYHSQVHRILAADFVTQESGTGIAHEAPAFGEDDYELVSTVLPKDSPQDWLFHPVDDYGEFTDEVPERAGQNVIDANKSIIAYLKDQGRLVKHETINHSYPHCPRTGEPLIYRAIESWFVKEDDLKANTVPAAELIDFIPESVKHRFINGLRSAPDWNISRSRFRGAPLPIWECNSCEHREVYGKIAQIEAKSGQQVDDLHRPYIDKIIIPCSQCGQPMQRVPEVLDCRFESGSMPYGQEHYLGEESDFTNKADFIAEGLDQTRGWFRSLHVLGMAVSDQRVFDHCVVTGMVLAEDGKKMSKSKKNYPDPSGLLLRYGADAFRLYLLGSPVVRAEPLRFSEQGVEQVMKDVVLPLTNVVNFLTTYADVDDWKHPGSELRVMRHVQKAASEGQEDREIPLSDEGFAYLESQSFVEQMIRIQPELIICSPAVRTRQTAEGVRDALHEHGYGEIEIREDDRVLIGSNDYTYLLEECRQSGKRVLVVSHKPVCEGLWTHQLGSLREGFGYGEVVRLPLIQLKNELDRRIMAELHKTIRSVDQALHLYDLEEATNQLVAFIDQLTNWYVRRSRRRFRSEGMEDDKVAAYTILYEVVMTYLKLLAPFAPFVTEKIWLDLQAYTHTASLIKQVDGEEMFASVHHQYRPLVSEKYIDQQLIKEIATVRKIIKGAMYLRAKQQIKVKQPLQELSFRL